MTTSTEPEHQPRERSVACQRCRRETWAYDAICSTCRAAEKTAAPAAPPSPPDAGAWARKMVEAKRHLELAERRVRCLSSLFDRVAASRQEALVALTAARFALEDVTKETLV